MFKKIGLLLGLVLLSPLAHASYFDDLDQAANACLCGPSSGGNATAQYRALVAADIPGLPYASSTLASTNIFVGNVSNVATARSLSGDATLSNTGALTLATVNSNVGSFTNANITVNAKGLITAAANGSSGGGSGSTIRAFNTQSSSTYTLALTDGWGNGNFPEILMNSSSAQTITVPNSSSVAFTSGDEVDIVQEGTGVVTVAAAGGVTVNSPGINLEGPNAFVSLLYLGSNNWLGTGNGWTGFVQGSGCTSTVQSGNFLVCLFTSSGTLTLSSGYGPVQYAAVGGGGSGGVGSVAGWGGGGGGGIVTGTDNLGTGTYSVGIGAGGASVSGSGANGNNGSNTTFNGHTAGGGGFGGGGVSTNNGGAGQANNGDGGGGGGGGGPTGGAGNGTGNAGGTATASGAGAGGGGASQVGVTNLVSGAGSAGGNGSTVTICGYSLGTFGGGGGGGNNTGNPTATNNAGGTGGGGTGGRSGTAGSGTANTGGGGGGAEGTSASGAGGTGYYAACWQNM